LAERFAAAMAAITNVLPAAFALYLEHPVADLE
jgi:hypothetical protein